jgi:hypothetical protein
MMTSVTTASPCFGTVRPLCFRPVRSQGTTRPGRFTGHSPQPLPETPYLHRATTTGSHVNASPSRCRRGDRPGHTRHPRGCRNAAYKRINHVTPAEMGIQTKSAVTWTHIPEIGSKFHYVDFRIETTNTSDEERKVEYCARKCSDAPDVCITYKAPPHNTSEVLETRAVQVERDNDALDGRSTTRQRDLLAGSRDVVSSAACGRWSRGSRARLGFRRAALPFGVH